MNFKKEDKPKTTLKVREAMVPQVFITKSALNTMFIYVDEVADEVGWLGTAYKNESHYLIDKVFLFDQEVHSTTTEITPEGLSSFAEELLQEPAGIETWNNMKMWGHSHVKMSIGPSGQDDKQMEEFAKIGHDFFIRLICNKHGDLGVDIYDYENGLEFHNVAWSIHDDIEDENVVELQKEVKELQRRIEQIEEEIKNKKKDEVEVIREQIKAEIKLKVKKLSYKTTPTYYKNGKKVKGTGYGWGSYLDYLDEELEEDVTGKSYYLEDEIDYTDLASAIVTNVVEDQIDNVKYTVYSYFTHQELMLYSEWSQGDFEYFIESMKEDGYFDILSINDLVYVYEAILKMDKIKYY